MASALAQAPEAERTLWQGEPSIWAFVSWAWALLLPVAWSYAVAKNTDFTVTSQRIRIATGVFSRTTQEIELYRVRDTSLAEPFWLRVLGLANLEIRTTDASTPSVTLRAIRGGMQLREQLRAAVEAVRERKGVRTFEA
jgi:uncharacterized membrane protein YdbT with pleckstrin-like domain